MGVAPVPCAIGPGSGRHMLFRGQSAPVNVAVATLADPVGIKVHVLISSILALLLDENAPFEIIHVWRDGCMCFTNAPELEPKLNDLLQISTPLQASVYQEFGGRHALSKYRWHFLSQRSSKG